jgi:Signal transduction protein containing GAF and PtsI domains
MESTRERTKALVEAGIALSSELSLDAVLQKLVETAATLTDAQYAALGVLDPSGSRLERFITAGIDDATRAEIGDLPSGRGILGVLIREARPLRLHDLGDDPALGRLPARPSRRCGRSSACPSRSAASSTGTSISRRRPTARTSTTTTRKPS